MDNYRERIDAYIARQRRRARLLYPFTWSVRAIRRLRDRIRRRLGGSRVVIIEQRSGFHAEFQSRRLGCLWRAAQETEEFREFTALLLDLGERYADIQRMRGRKLPRQQARRFATQVARHV